MAIRKTVIKRYESQAWVDNYPVTAWAYIENIPSTFPPSAHTHNYAGSSSAGGDANNAVKLNGQAASYYLNYNNFTNTPTIPTKTSQLTNDSGYLTSSTLTGDVVIDALGYTPGTSNFTGYTSSNKLSTSYISGLATVATSGSYNDLSNKPTIPTKASWNYDDRYVRYDTASQGLTDTQKANARTNIGAGTSNFTGYTDSNRLGSGYISGITEYDTLSEELSAMYSIMATKYVKPSGGIPASDLAQTYYLASNPNGYTSNTGTVTSVAVKMNGSVKGTITTSGTIDLGTVLTSHQDISGKLDKSGGTMTGTLNSRDIIPTATRTYNLGSSSYMFNNLYVNNVRTGLIQSGGAYLGIYAGSDTIGLNIDAGGTYPQVNFTENGGIYMASVGVSFVGAEYGESVDDRVDYLRIGTGNAVHYGADGYAELQLSCVASGESYSDRDYVSIRPLGASAGGIIYLPNVSRGSEVTLATIYDIPSTLPADYLTTPPSSDNYTGIKFVLLNSSTYPPASVTKRNGYIYMWY